MKTTYGSWRKTQAPLSTRSNNRLPTSAPSSLTQPYGGPGTLSAITHTGFAYEVPSEANRMHVKFRRPSFHHDSADEDVSEEKLHEEPKEEKLHEEPDEDPDADA